MVAEVPVNAFDHALSAWPDQPDRTQLAIPNLELWDETAWENINCSRLIFPSPLGKGFCLPKNTIRWNF